MDAISEWISDMPESGNTSNLIEEYSKTLSINLIDREFADLGGKETNIPFQSYDTIKIATLIGIAIILAYALPKIALFRWLVCDTEKEKPQKLPTVLMTAPSLDLDQKTKEENRLTAVPGVEGVQSITEGMRVLTVEDEDRYPDDPEVNEENRDPTAMKEEIPKWVRQSGRMRKIVSLEGNSHHHY